MALKLEAGVLFIDVLPPGSNKKKTNGEKRFCVLMTPGKFPGTLQNAKLIGIS